MLIYSAKDDPFTSPYRAQDFTFAPNAVTEVKNEEAAKHFIDHFPFLAHVSSRNLKEKVNKAQVSAAEEAWTQHLAAAARDRKKHQERTGLAPSRSARAIEEKARKRGVA